MANPFIDIHPDDILFFNEINDLMWKVARSYKLPLKKVIGMPRPEYTKTETGDCSHDGVIRLTLRGMTNGIWDTDPRHPNDVWKTAAHELAHLRHFDHSKEFWEFEEEMQRAISNARKPADNRQKVLDKLVKLQNSRESEASMGNLDAAEAFAGMINKMLIENELNPTDIDYARATDHDPVIQLETNWRQHQREGDNPKLFQPAKHRIAWQETLAGIVAEAHLCKFLITRHSDTIWFVGTKSHATVAEYVYTMLVIRSHQMAKNATQQFKRQVKRQGEPERASGYWEAWVDGFIRRIEERFKEARRDAIRQSVVEPGHTESQALMRLNGALIKAQKFIDDKFTGRTKSLNPIRHRGGYNPDGLRDGKVAADAMPIGRRGMEQGPVRGKIGDGK